MTETPADRLKQARIAKGYPSAAAFAEAIRATDVTYRSHENGSRKLTATAAKQYAPYLGVSWQWLLFNGDLDVHTADEALEREPEPRSRRQAASGARILELDVRASAGDGLLHDVVADEKVIAEWTMPPTVLRAQTSAPTEQLRIITVYGDSMTPDFNPGERVLVDCDDRRPSPPGVFALWDGFGLVIKRIEVIPYSNPPMVRLISRNASYGTYERPLEEVIINGRVIGKWQWT